MPSQKVLRKSKPKIKNLLHLLRGNAYKALVESPNRKGAEGQLPETIDHIEKHGYETVVANLRHDEKVIGGALKAYS